MTVDVITEILIKRPVHEVAASCQRLLMMPSTTVRLG